MQILRNLKDAFWPFQRGTADSLFLKAANAANCIDKFNGFEDRYFIYISIQSVFRCYFGVLGYDFTFISCSGYRLASAKAAQHRLDRGVWTSVHFGDMRRALSGMIRWCCMSKYFFILGITYQDH